MAGPAMYAGKQGTWQGGYVESAQYSGTGSFTGAQDLTTGTWQATTSIRYFVNGEILGMNRTDGYDGPNLEFQGPRTYDENVGQWTTPDPFEGVTDDPMTQRPYMWNGNNAVKYSDPSGYVYPCSSCTDDGFGDDLEDGYDPSQSAYQEGDDCHGLAMCFAGVDSVTAHQLKNNQQMLEYEAEGATFIIGGALGPDGILAVVKTLQNGYEVFYSGVSSKMAEEVAEQYGAKTIGETSVGRLLTGVQNALESRYDPAIVFKIMDPVWKAASIGFAALAREALVILNEDAMRENATWYLEQRVLNFLR